MFDIAGYLVAGLAGWCGGMLTNYLADVLPHRRRLVLPFCAYCSGFPGWFQYFLYPYVCRSCGHRRGHRTWIVEVVGIAIALWLKNNPSNRLDFLPSLILMIFLGVVTVIDIEHRLILHPVCLAGAVLGGWVGVSLRGWQATLTGGLVGFGVMLLLYLFGFWLMSIISRRRGQQLEDEPLGFGDVNFAGVMGLLLGWPGIVAGIVLTILLAGAGALFFIAIKFLQKRYQPDLYIAYGPFMVLSIVILLFFR